MDKKELKVGQVWRTRAGQEVTLTNAFRGTATAYPFYANTGESYTVRGTVWADDESDADLIELVQDVPEIATTAAAGAAPVIPAWVKTAEEAAIPDTEIARTIAQFIASKRISLSAASDQRERLQRELHDAINLEADLGNEIEQAEIALAALK